MTAMPPPLSFRRKRQSLARVLRIPALLFVATLVGLVLGLTGSGLPDWAAWLLLALPLFAMLAGWWRRA